MGFFWSISVFFWGKFLAFVVAESKFQLFISKIWEAARRFFFFFE